ncbi:Alpha/Beta hydrolase protein [Xylariomycetidae sp. FL2044]|nr:Alpha/Beta hydrolase protein [Xylariomycetidae sp. FL2044]
MSLEKTFLTGPNGRRLELLYSLPPATTTTTGAAPRPPDRIPPPLLFVHGAYCSAHCYMFLLPYLASHGYPAYAISVRGHGASRAQPWLNKMLFTTFDSWAADVRVALAHATAAHPNAPPPVLGGHSLGGGLVQYMVSSRLYRSPGHHKPVDGARDVSALILLAAAPLGGQGSGISKNWEHVEAPNGYKYPWSPRCQLDTPEQVRAAFFSDDTADQVVDTWIGKCRTYTESARAGLSIFRPLGEARRVLDALTGLDSTQGQRKVLCVGATKDRLVTLDMVYGNAEVYEKAATNDAAQKDEGACSTLVVEGAGHHLMMDEHWQKAAEGIVKWLDGR